ncbi:hypothetical protein B0H63DRAFT_519909 [Podospora didyma]|uniref:Oxidase n=1 Tax=Podospora didyma TaxID=330526 RepID=A0AAE0U4H1_9PEZI|nr:hypothetical protein B0H63DRAFT_519909 [Podospora didyma]
MSRLSNSSYTAVDSDSEKGEHEGFLDSDNDSHRDHALASPRQSRTERAAAILPWLLSIFFAVVSLCLLLERRGTTNSLGTYEDGFSTGIITPSKIPLEQIRFRRGPHFFPNGTAWLDPVDKTAPWPENIKLFGPPSPEIDANWGKLIGGRYFSISEEEAIRAWGDDRFQYVDELQGGYSAGLEVFHTLHCLNALRIMLHDDYYHSHHSHGPFHTEHCLDAIRQTIQCYGSTTLIPTKYGKGIKHNYIDSDQVHTCRSFQYLREFTTSRQPGHVNYVERDMSLINEKNHRKALKWKERKQEYMASQAKSHMHDDEVADVV